MIVLTRDIIEVLASFIIWSNKNPNNFHDRINLKTVEEQCENLMQGSILSQNLMAIENLLLPENKDLYHLVRYNDLINNTINSKDNRTLRIVKLILNFPKLKGSFLA